MNINQILIQALGPIISNYWWFWLLLAILGFLKTPFMKGVLGEFQVNLIAKLRLDKQIYTLFKNVTLRTEDGGTTQIDHVIVSRYGVFVIETKNIKGWIFGGEHQKTWTQKIYRHTNKFQNPLHQNYKHTQTLQSALELTPDQLFSVVVFIGDSEFQTPMPDNVVYAGSYIRFIKSKQQPILRESEVADICRKLESGRLKPSIKTHVEHVKHVRNIVEQKQQQAENACPKCGKPMVLRTAKNGENQGNQFWGCSGFPQCRAMRPV
ncbi:nuclease-related domain-containing protein [Methylomonas albis]|uniref:NERD domain-containing protein n=1 Tax=Methylomonas albis TaxID=1854563 RepID=A0ABR9D660_9GAMM|nr:NERD domain-containing protein [Methylomonas albis]MBD9358609.1 NERD domain-containing protein [Methylomonas albis]